MKRLIIVLGLVCLATPAAFAQDKSLLALVTVYWASGGAGSDSWTRNHQAATHVRLRAGHCAVDPRQIPYGSKVVIADTTCVAVDTGKHVVTRRAARRAGHTPLERNALVIDRFFETKTQALSWARTHPHFMTVRVLSPNEPSGRPPSVSAVMTKPATPTLVADNSPSPALVRAESMASRPGFAQPVSPLP